MADPQVIQQTQTTIPDYAAPWVENMLGMSGSLVYNYRDAQGNVKYDQNGLPIPQGFAPYMQYQGERFAQFSPLQQQAMAQMQSMRAAPQMADATGIAGLAAQRALNYGYTPGQATNQFVRPQEYMAGQFRTPDINLSDLQKYQLGAPETVRSMAVQSPTINAAQMQYAPTLQNYQQGPAQEVKGSQLTAPQMQAAQTQYAPKVEAFQMGPAQQVSGNQITAPTMQAAQATFNPELQRFQMQAPSTRVSTQSFAQPEAAQQYMSPYMQNVVDIEKREAQRQADIAATSRGQKYARAGAFGGARQAIENAEAARNLAQLKGDLQSKGMQSAYSQAQQQFNAEQNARLTAQQANLGAEMTTGQQNLAAALGVQQLGTQTGLQTSLANLNAAQQAAVQNQATQFQALGMNSQQAMQAALANQQMGFNVGQQNLASAQNAQQLGVQTGLQTSLANQQAAQQAAVQNQATQFQALGMTAQQAMQAALANQQAGLTVGGQNQAAALGVQQLGVNTGLQTGLANLNASQQAAVQNAANNLQAQGLTSQQALQAAMANQQMGYNVGTQNLNAMLGVQQFGAGQNLQAQLANQQAMLQAQQMAEQSRQFGYGQQMQAAGLGAQYGQAAQQLNEQSAQFGAGLGLQGLQTAMTGAGQLGNLGQNQFNQNMGINQMLSQYGGMQQQQTQNMLNAQYQDYLNNQNQPYKQMGFMSDMLRGLPLNQYSQSTYQAPPSTMSQIAGLGTAAYGASKMFGGFADGGAVEDVPYRDKPAGLADLAIANMST